jgi:hypothetical protein
MSLILLLYLLQTLMFGVSRQQKKLHVGIKFLLREAFKVKAENR